MPIFKTFANTATRWMYAHEHGATIFLATPRIQKPDEMGIFHALAKHGADGILVRNLAGLRFFREQRHSDDRRFLAQRGQRADRAVSD